jgi:hypothetical protein
VKTHHYLRRLQTKLNLLAFTKGLSAVTEDDINVVKTEFLDGLSSVLGPQNLNTLQKEMGLIDISHAITRICDRCKITQSISHFYFTKDGKRVLPTCKLCAAQKWQSDKNLGQNFFAHSLSSARKRAAAKGLPCDIDSDYLKSIYPRDQKCPIFGITMKAGVRGDNDSAPSLDKIIPERGYTRGNVWYISMRANRIKSEHSLKDILIAACGIHKKLMEIGADIPVVPRLMSQLIVEIGI